MTEAFELSEDAISVTDGCGILERVNPAFLRLYRFERPGLVLGRSMDELWPPRSMVEASRLKDRIGAGIPWNGEMAAAAGDGSEVLVRVAAHPLGTPGAIRGWICFSRDRTRQEALEKELFHAHNLARLGALGAGLAHEINGPLASVLLDAESLRDQLHEAPAWKRKSAALDSAESIVRGAERMRRVLGHLLLGFNAGPGSRAAILGVRKLLEDALLPMDKRLAAGGISVGMVCGRELRVAGNPIELESVLQNLFTNSLEAFPRTARNKRILLSVRGEPLHGRIILEYRDNAGGMPAEILQRVCEPFFTTKEGPGRGLGMAISSLIIARHGGSMECQSSGDEAVFRITFPMAESCAA